MSPAKLYTKTVEESAGSTIMHAVITFHHNTRAWLSSQSGLGLGLHEYTR